MTMTRQFLAAALLAALAAGAHGQGQKKPGEARGAQPAEAGKPAAAIVLVPFVVSAAPNFGDGCWARLYDGQNFTGDHLTVVGPTDMPNMRTAFGTDWSGSFDSLQTGPRATVTVYDNENYTQKVTTFKPNQRIADLDERRGMFEDIRSLKIACSGGGAATGGSQPQAKDKDTANGKTK